MDGQIPQQTAQQSTQSPSEGQASHNPQFSYQSPQIKTPTGALRKIFNFASWVVLIIFLPITVLILISQDSVPGDLFYPVKRGLENAILAAASVNPATRAAFKTDLTEVRFKEAAKLLIAKADTAGLSDFITSVETTQEEVGNLSNEEAKRKLKDKLIAKIDEYQTKLTQAQSQVQNNLAFSEGEKPTSEQTVSQQQSPSTATTTSPSQAPTVISTPLPTNLSFQTFPTPTQVLTPTPTFAPNTTPLPSQKPQVSPMPPTAPVPTNSPVSTPAPAASVPISAAQAPPQPQISAPQTASQANVKIAIEKTQEKLEEIKKRLEEKHEEKERDKENDGDQNGRNKNHEDKKEKKD